jgi:hypothetical protein
VGDQPPAQRGTKAERDGQPMRQSGLQRELHCLRDGKIYQFVLSTKTGSKRLEHFWLCGDCSKTMILTRVNRADVETERLIQDHAKQKGRTADF